MGSHSDRLIGLQSESLTYRQRAVDLWPHVCSRRRVLAPHSPVCLCLCVCVGEGGCTTLIKPAADVIHTLNCGLCQFSCLSQSHCHRSFSFFFAILELCQGPSSTDNSAALACCLKNKSLSKTGIGMWGGSLFVDMANTQKCTGNNAFKGVYFAQN